MDVYITKSWFAIDISVNLSNSLLTSTSKNGILLFCSIPIVDGI